MSTLVNTGDVVYVKLYGGETAIRRVLAVKGDRIVVCSEEEFAAAQREGREPLALAFPRVDVIGPVTPHHPGGPQA